MNSYLRLPAPVVTRTDVVITLFFVQVIMTVTDPITFEKRGQAQTLRADEMGFWALRNISQKLHFWIWLHLNHVRSWIEVFVIVFPQPTGGHKFIREVITMRRWGVTQLVHPNTLTTITSHRVGWTRVKLTERLVWWFRTIRNKITYLKKRLIYYLLFIEVEGGIDIYGSVESGYPPRLRWITILFTYNIKKT